MKDEDHVIRILWNSVGIANSQGAPYKTYLITYLGRRGNVRKGREPRDVYDPNQPGPKYFGVLFYTATFQAI